MRRAAALASVLFVMGFASALAVSAAFVARQLATSARLAQRGDALQVAAETAIADVIAVWDSAARANQPIGSSVQVSLSADTLTTETWVTRANPSVYWIVAESRSPLPPPVRRRVGALIRVGGDGSVRLTRRAWAALP